MSVKAQALVWDLECPKQYGDIAFKPSHKYTLIAYADHADHSGKNIFPAVATIASKTGLDERTIQRLTNDLEAIGLLIEDGQGPRGTNRWKLPYNDRGDKLTPLTNCRGDKNPDLLGDIPSGDIPSGDKLTPELNEPEPLYIDIWEKITDSIKGEMRRDSFANHIETARIIDLDEETLTIEAKSDFSRDWLESRLTSTIKKKMIGILNRPVNVYFVVKS